MKEYMQMHAERVVMDVRASQNKTTEKIPSHTHVTDIFTGPSRAMN
jgi:hypothetical protein